MTIPTYTTIARLSRTNVVGFDGARVVRHDGLVLGTVERVSGGWMVKALGFVAQPGSTVRGPRPGFDARMHLVRVEARLLRTAVALFVAQMGAALPVEQGTERQAAYAADLRSKAAADLEGIAGRLRADDRSGIAATLACWAALAGASTRTILDKKPRASTYGGASRYLDVARMFATLDRSAALALDEALTDEMEAVAA